jgi:hypothetical protein
MRLGVGGTGSELKDGVVEQQLSSKEIAAAAQSFDQRKIAGKRLTNPPRGGKLRQWGAETSSNSNVHADDSRLIGPPSGGKVRQWEALGMSRATWYRCGKPTEKPKHRYRVVASALCSATLPSGAKNYARKSFRRSANSNLRVSRVLAKWQADDAISGQRP